MTPQRAQAQAIQWPLQMQVKQLTTSELEKLHNEGLRLFRQGQSQSGDVSWIEIKAELAQRYLKKCNFCVHNCLVDRTQNITGYCQLDDKHYVSGEYIHTGEEAELIPTHAFFFSGCTMHCLYCHNWRDTFTQKPEYLTTPQKVVTQIIERSAQSKTISWIGGTPEPHLHTLLAVARDLPKEIKQPMVFNSNATLSDVGLELLEGVIDIYLPDFKHGNTDCAWKLTKIDNYVDTLVNNLRAYKKQKSRVIIRHLLLPGHLHCCTEPIFQILAQEFQEIPVNLMNQYRPMYKAENIEGIDHKLSKTEAKDALNMAQKMGLTLH